MTTPEQPGQPDRREPEDVWGTAQTPWRNAQPPPPRPGPPPPPPPGFRPQPSKPSSLGSQPLLIVAIVVGVWFLLFVVFGIIGALAGY